MAKVLNFLQKLSNFFKSQSATEAYLSRSIDMADLETRMKELRHASPQYKYRSCL